jgi:hypothetical protein
MKLTITKWFAVALLAMLCLGTSTVLAQSVTTAAISGKITSTTGEALPGANVIATHNPSGTTYGTSSRNDGRYDLPGLRVGGPYTLTVSFVGYAQQKRENITLQLSQTMTQNFVMQESAVQLGEVQIVGERNAIMSAARTGAASNVIRAQMDRLPTISRSFQDYYAVSPYFNGSSTSGTSVAGRNNKYNNIQIDGADFNDMFGLGSTGTPAGQSSVTPISLDAIEEFQVVVSPFDVRQAGFTGAGVNAVTRSGTNSLKGSAFYNRRNQDLVGVSPDALAAKLPNFTETSVGFRLGGPIIENKLFFFVNGELARKEAPFTRTYGNDKVGTNASTAIADSLKILSDFLQTKYGYATGSWTDIPQFDNSDKFFLRFDYNLSENHKLTARWNYLSSIDDNSPSRFRGNSDFYSENARYKLNNKTNSFALQVSSLFGNTASNELIVGYNHQLDQPTYYGQPFPTVEVRTIGAGSDKTVQRLAAGAEEFRHYNELEQKHLEVTENFTWYLQGHTITAGAKLDIFSFRNLFISDGFGWYQFNSVAAFLNNANIKPDGFAYRYSATSNPQQEANFGANQIGFYIQDEWTVMPTLKVTAGVRFDIPSFPDKPRYNRAFDSTFTARGYNLSTDKLPASYVAISPRIGFNWAVDEERNTQVRGGVGLFSGRFPMVWVSNQYASNGVDFYLTSYTSTAAVPSTVRFNPDPYNQPKLATSLPTAEVDITDPNFKAPSIIRTNLGLDQKLPYDLVLSVEGLFSWSQNEVYYQNINLSGQQTNSGLTAGGTLAGERRAVWGVLSQTTGKYTTAGVKVNGAFTAAYLVKNTDLGSNSNITVQLQRQNPTDGLFASAGYTWGSAKDIGGSNSTTASSGWRFNPTTGDPNNPVLTYADNDRTHRIFGTVSYRFDWGSSGFATTLGVFYNGLSGQRFSYVVNGDVNGDALSDNDLAYIPKDANDIILMGATDPTKPVGTTNPLIKLTDKSRVEYAQLMAFIDKDPYLKDHKGQISDRNGPMAPWSDLISMRLTQEIPSVYGHRIELTFDVLNVMNLIDKTKGWVRLPGTNNPFMYNFDSIETTSGSADYGKPRYVWTNPSDPSVPSNTVSRWSANFGIRYTF